MKIKSLFFLLFKLVVHDDILGGMNNWLEHRCPMSIYGCGFSQRRIFPSSRDTLIYSPAVESFGITRRDLTKKSPEVNKQLTTSSRKSKGNIDGNQTTSVKNLIDLPIELLLEIFNYLESFRYAYYNIIIFLSILPNEPKHKFHENFVKSNR